MRIYHVFFYNYEYSTHEQRKEIKHQMCENPTREDIALLWQQ